MGKTVKAKIFCAFDPQLDLFFKKVVKIIIATWGEYLSLEGLEELELVEENTSGLYNSSDGRMINSGKKILISARLFKMLPHYRIDELKHNPEYCQIVSTVYHELGHISDMTTMPNLYAAAQDYNDKNKMVAAFFWVEYLAEKRSNLINPFENSEFCDSFVNRKWQAYMWDYDTPSESNYFFLCKCLSYFMGRTTNVLTRKEYCKKMSNPLLKGLSIEIGKEIFILERQYPFDDVDTLANLAGIMGSYYLRFQQTFSPAP